MTEPQIRSANMEKEKKRKAFFKRQQKFYCQSAWAELQKRLIFLKMFFKHFGQKSKF